MVKVYTEDIKSNFKGTIIDLETIGYFRDGYQDSRRCKDIMPVIFGFINKSGLKIYCAENKKSIGKLKKKIKIVLPRLKKPFYAFNTGFEKSVLFYFLGERIPFQGELNMKKYEAKWRVVQSLGIPNYDDPFYDDSMACMSAWINGEIDESIKHNRSCLLKERDILLIRGFRKPDELKLIP